ncbi:MAG: DNA cytosine methyltransferase [Acidimicrobiia bacterium]|nr:DNA cytosine methyltransferase [Acidimicrobiia bacterium]
MPKRLPAAQPRLTISRRREDGIRRSHGRVRNSPPATASVHDSGRFPLGKREPQSRLPKLDPKKPSPTLRAGTGREHGSHTPVRPVHYSLPRVITVREAARLHAFPDWFGFTRRDGMPSGRLEFSPPPPLGRAVASALVAVAWRDACGHGAVELGDAERLKLSLGEAARELNVPASQLPPPRRRDA